MPSLDPAMIAFVREQAASNRFRDLMRDWLVKLVGINTAPDHDLEASAAREKTFWTTLSGFIEQAGGGTARVEPAPLPAAIESDADYSFPGYALRADGARPGAADIYRGRNNLFAVVGDASAKPAVILHAHADVVPPWFDARVEGQRVLGRGACDNKAQIAVLLAQMQILRELEAKFPDLKLAPRVYQFTLDEETGGNGSVAAALDPRYAKLPVLMHESTDLVPYCAHRGCVYYRVELSIGANSDMTAVELFPFVVLSLEAEGRKIQRETNAPGFTAAHVQTNQGVLGPCGEHPGNVCDHVAIDLVTFTNANPDRLAMKLTQYLDEALIEYVARYGDKTKEADDTGRPKVAKHFDVKVLPSQEGQRVRVDVHGKSGHMAAVRACDNAITKAALLFGALLKNSHKYPNIRAFGLMSDVPESDPQHTLVLEGGQGFTPSHTMAQIKSRVTEAAVDAVRKYCRLRGRRFDANMVRVSFERLHNDAYSQPADSAPMKALLDACAAAGVNAPTPVAWETSCDARIYHHKGHPVAIFGAGKLHVAHSDQEYVDLDDLSRALAVSTLATLSLV